MGTHTTSVRVRYPEVDRMGVAHHSHYLVWFEVGRTEMMRASGNAYDALEKSGVSFPVIESGVIYRSPARYDDELTVETWVESIEGIRVRYSYRILRGTDELASGFTVHAPVDSRLQPIRLQPELRKRLEALKTLKTIKMKRG